MSLINDALKKARATQPMGSASGVTPGPALRRRSAPRGKGASFLTLAIAVVLVLAAVLLLAWYHAGRENLVARAKTPAVSVAPKPMVETALATVPAVQQAHTQIVSPAPAETPAAPPAPEVHAAPPPIAAPPPAEFMPPQHVRTLSNAPKPVARTYKLEGIFYSPKGPSAVIDGDLVSVGSEVQDGQVVAIDNESATVVTTAGETNVLVLVR
jgi:type IV secretory pathway VirB10-like protein